MNKFVEFQILIAQENPDIFALTEFGANSLVMDSELNVPGYTLYRKNHSSGTGGPGKGIALYVNDSLRHSPCNYMEDSDHVKNFDTSIWIKVNLPTTCIMIGNVYRSPNSSDTNNDRLIEILKHANRGRFSDLVLLGDYNLPKIDWFSGAVNDHEQSVSYKFMDSLEDLGLFQHVKKPTRFRSDHEPSLLDLIMTKDDSLSPISHLSPIGKSDHMVLKCNLVIQHSNFKNTERVIYRFARADWNNFRRHLSETDWNFIESDGVDESYCKIIDILLSLKQRYVPTATFREKPNPPYTKQRQVKLAIERKKAAFRKYNRSKDPEHQREYRDARNQVTHLINLARINHEKNIIQDTANPRRFDSYCRRKMKNKKGVSNLVKPDGSETASDIETAELFNEFFQSVFTRDVTQPPSLEDPPTRNIAPPGVSLENLNFNEEAVEKTFRDIKTNKATGPDGIDAAIWKNCATELKGPMYRLYKKCFDTTTLPTIWKKSEISPIYKKGVPNIPQNFRPVNIICEAWKRFQILAVEELKPFFAQFLSPAQHGFVKGRSPLSNMLECLEAWTRAVDEGHWVDIIYFDYKTAFDKVSHALLLQKLKWYGIGGKLWLLIKAFLTGCQQRVKVGNSKSSWREVFSSVIQGSVLGVWLFVLFINDLPDTCLPVLPPPPAAAIHLKPRVDLLADDTKASGVIQRDTAGQDSRAIQNTVTRITEWAIENRMEIHPDKTKVLHVGEDNPHFTYKLGDLEIAATSQHKDIGFLINENLSNTDHVMNNRQKAMAAIATIRRTFKVIDKKSFTILYNRHIRPHLEYGTIACPPETQAEAQALDRVQAKATYLVNNLKNRSPEERRIVLGLFPLAYRRTRGDLIEVFKILNGITDRNPNNLWEVRQTRNGPNLVKNILGPTLPGRGLRRRRKFFSYRMIQQWNLLPPRIKNAASLSAFKRSLDKFMQSTQWTAYAQQM